MNMGQPVSHRFDDLSGYIVMTFHHNVTGMMVNVAGNYPHMAELFSLGNDEIDPDAVIWTADYKKPCNFNRGYSSIAHLSRTVGGA